MLLRWYAATAPPCHSCTCTCTLPLHPGAWEPLGPKIRPYVQIACRPGTKGRPPPPTHTHHTSSLIPSCAPPPTPPSASSVCERLFARGGRAWLCRRTGELWGAATGRFDLVTSGCQADLRVEAEVLDCFTPARRSATCALFSLRSRTEGGNRILRATGGGACMHSMHAHHVCCLSCGKQAFFKSERIVTRES